MTSDEFDLASFDSYREGNRLEVKKANGGLPLSLWETYSSFSNCDGGLIILGVREESDGRWRTTRLQNREKLLKDFWDLINNPAKVSVNLLKEDDVATYDVDGDVVIVVRVPRADRCFRPVYVNGALFGGTFRRNHEGDYRCTESEVRGMLRDQAEKSADDKILVDMDLSVLNAETIKSFRSRHHAVNEKHVWHKLDDPDYLERIGAAKTGPRGAAELHPTVAGLLMFGEEYKIRYEYPEFFLDFREILDPSLRWTDRLESSSGEWSGNLVDFFFALERKLLRDLKKPFQLDGFTRIDETPVHRAVREALANCLVNADFNFPRGVVVLKRPDLLVFENPGSIIPGKPQMLKGGISEPRNRTIMKMFNLIRIGERAGSGVPEIFSVWEEEGWPSPVVEEFFKPDRTILTLSFADNQAETSGESAAKSAGKSTGNAAGNTAGNHVKKTSEMQDNKQVETSGESADFAAAKSAGESAKNHVKKATEKQDSKQVEESGESAKNTIGESAGKSAKYHVKKATEKRDSKQVEEGGESAKNVVEKTSEIGEKMMNYQKRIFTFLQRISDAKTEEIAAYLGLRVSRARALIAEMVDEGVVVAEGNARARRYSLADKQSPKES